MTDPLSLEDAKKLVRFCETGRLYAVEEWIRAGRALVVPPDLKKTPLDIAMRTGFHSLIELLLRHETNQAIKNDVLKQAVQKRRPDLVELAVAYGAEMSSVQFAEVLESWDKSIVAFFVDRGADLVTGVPFAWAFHDHIRTALGSYLDCKRRRPDLRRQLQEQANIALRQACRDNNLKWVSLLMWVGADPRSTGPTIEDLDDPEMATTAFDQACTWGDLELLKRLKPDSAIDDLSELLQSASFFARTEIMSYLLTLGANPNDKPDRSSKSLENCLRHLGWEDRDAVLYGGRDHQTPAYKVSRTREAIRMLAERGAVWRPDATSLNDVRRILYKTDPEVTVEVAGLFLKYGTCNDATLHDLLRPGRMQEHLIPVENRLARVGLTLDGRRKSEVREPKKREPSAYVSTHYDREKLYKQVWSEPTQKIAKEYGISDVALAKVCWQLNIPKPPRGYWAKKAAGRPVPRRPRLPSFPSPTQR